MITHLHPAGRPAAIRAKHRSRSQRRRPRWDNLEARGMMQERPNSGFDPMDALTPDTRLEKARATRRAYDARNRERNRERQRVANMTPEQIARKYELHRASRSRIYARDPEGTKAKWRAEYFKRFPMVEGAAEDAMATLSKAIPRALPHHVRDDVMGSIMLAVLEGKVKARDVGSAVKLHLAAYYREYDQFKTRSLDAVIPGTDNLRLVDTIPAPIADDAPETD